MTFAELKSDLGNYQLPNGEQIRINQLYWIIYRGIQDWITLTDSIPDPQINAPVIRKKVEASLNFNSVAEMAKYLTSKDSRTPNGGINEYRAYQEECRLKGLPNFQTDPYAFMMAALLNVSIRDVENMEVKLRVTAKESLQNIFQSI